MKSFSNRILAWYNKNFRKLPWRIGPYEQKVGKKPNVYNVWLSEIMLQQTTIRTVKPYYHKFLELWPSISDLAEASENDVLVAWAGLGYYSRARNLNKCAKIVVNNLDGLFPKTAEELKQLPGIGDYTSAAIAAIAFNEAAPAVDGNIERVISRVTAEKTPLPQLKNICREFMIENICSKRPGDFIQAMMDIGSTICKPKSPVCRICPLYQICKARNTNTQELYPVKKKSKPKPTRYGAAFLAYNSKGNIWLIRRPRNGLLAGMVSIPMSDWNLIQNGKCGAPPAWLDEDWKLSSTVQHPFTHFHLEIEVWTAFTEIKLDDGWWSEPCKLVKEALPTLIKKIIIASQMTDDYSG
ncbi:A/G-specific adenine glycosylase [Candidatus Endowatersipora endosymbiont of Watersipora subatra]|uniref:A/G-specific adenine glycosylase n=1 Tax=Candidatus Endowatersipora endosymbiont of Watersipora subatra TaxID=3077946 RepID=UPI00312CAF99